MSFCKLAYCSASIAVLSMALACGEKAKEPAGTAYDQPGALVSDLQLSETDRAELQKVEQKLAALDGLTAADLIAQRAPANDAELDYSPSAAANLDLLQKSALALNAKELEKLGQQGFVIAPRHAFPNMAYGYKTIYSLDLPVYVSLDAILETVHLSYDAILKTLEQTSLTAELTTLLNSARESLAAGVVADPQTAKDLDLYFAVTLSLLQNELSEPVSGADASQIKKLFEAASAARGIVRVDLFGAARDVDFTQFTPRGHYEDSDELKRYFRASMWLGRTDFRLIETQPDGTQVFRRRQLESVLAMREVVTGAARDAFDHLDAVVSAFVGEHDYMELREVDRLADDLGGEAWRNLSDQQIAQTIIEKGYGAQRIASQVIFKDSGASVKTLPLDRSFALLGQRYTADSHVFSNVVYDRVNYPNAKPRYLPNPLDAAYAAMGNGAALPLLESELELHGYAPDLERMRVLIDEHGETYWSANLYNLWLSSLRAMSPETAGPAAVPHGLSAVMGTDGWQRRVLNTQLASWAELRHDTILYVKQSYTTGDECVFPDGYVDPYPAAFERLRLYALKGAEVIAQLSGGKNAELQTRIASYFEELAQVATMLRQMAEQEQTGVPFNDEQMAFLNDAVKSKGQGCGGPESYDGWFARLLFDTSDEDMDPTIADVHTDPGGTRPPKVLHVGTGLPRLLVVTANTCEGPRAYAGLAFAYHEVVTDDLERLTDNKWQTMARAAEDVPWMKPILP